MRVSACAAILTALLATEASAGETYSWRWWSSSGTRPQRSGNRGKTVKTVYTTVYVSAPTQAPVNAAPAVPDAAEAEPTTLVLVTTQPAEEEAPVATSPPTAAAPVEDNEPAAEAPSSGGSSSSNLSGDAQKALDAHNAARSEVNNPALSWDDALAADALAWAQHLASIGSLTHASGTGQGENLYMSSGRSGDHLTTASDLWIAEKSDYSGQRIGEGNFASYGHYTQAVWKSTTKVGIAAASGPSGTYVVARYSPPGNMQGETPF